MPDSDADQKPAPILTDDAFKVSRDLLQQRYETDRRIANLRKSISNREEIAKKGRVKIRSRLAKYNKAQGKIIGAFHNAIATRKKAIRKIEKMKLIRKAAEEFQRRVRKEGLTVK